MASISVLYSELHDRLHQLFAYNDGQFIRKIKTGPTTKIGDVAGGLVKSIGYHMVRVDAKRYLLHRLIFLYHHKRLPKVVDHRDRDKLNNRIENLREATKSQNNANSRSRGGKSKYKGVYWSKWTNKWVASISVNYKRKHIGYFTSETDAAIAYNTAAIEFFGEFAATNVIV